MHTSNGARARNLTFTTSVIPSRQAHDHTAYAQFTNATNVTLRNTNAIAGNVVLDATNIHWAAVYVIYTLDFGPVLNDFTRSPELQQSIHSLRLTGFVVCLLSWLLYKYS